MVARQGLINASSNGRRTVDAVLSRLSDRVGFPTRSGRIFLVAVAVLASVCALVALLGPDDLRSRVGPELAIAQSACPVSSHNHAYSPNWCHPDSHLVVPACHATERLRYRIHRTNSTHEYRYVEPCAPVSTTAVPPRCAAGEHAHNPVYGSGYHRPGLKNTAAHRNAHGGGIGAAGCSGGHPATPPASTTTVPPRCAAGEHAHNPVYGSGYHRPGLKNTAAHRNAHGGGIGAAGCSGGHPATPPASTTTVPPASTTTVPPASTTTVPPASTTTVPPAVSPPTTSGPSPGCAVSLGTLMSSLSPQVGVLQSRCVSRSRSATASNAYFARRYEFRLASPAWLTIDLRSASDQSPVLDAYLQLLSGHGAGGDVLHFDDDGGIKHDARLADRFVAAGDYTIEASAYRRETGGRFELEVQVLTPADAAGSVIISGLPPSIRTVVGKELELPFTYAFVPDPAQPNALSVQLEPSLLYSPPSVAVSLDYSAGSGIVRFNPRVSLGEHNIILQFKEIAIERKLGLYGFTVTVCSAGSQLALHDATCSHGARPVPTVITPPYSVVSTSCIERLPVKRWAMVKRRWSNDGACSLPGVGKRPVRYYAFEVPFNSARVVIRLAADQDAYLTLAGPSGWPGSSSSVILASTTNDDNGYQDYGHSNSTNSWLTAELARGVYVIGATVATSFNPVVSDSFILTVKIPYPDGACPPISTPSLPAGATAASAEFAPTSVLALLPQWATATSEQVC